MNGVRVWLLAISALAAIAMAASCAAPRYGRIISASDDNTAAGDYLKGRFAARKQQLDFAAEAYEAAAAAAPFDATLLQKAFFYELASGNVPGAVPYAEKILQPEYQSQDKEATPGSSRQPTMALPRLTVATNHIKRGRYADAREILSQRADSRFSNSISYLMEAWAAYEDGGLEQGLAVLSDDGPELFTAFAPLHRAIMLDLEGKFAEARTEYEAAVASFGSDVAIFAYADFLEWTGRDDPENRDQALELYRNLARDAGTLRRAGRLGLARLGEPLAEETEQSLKWAARKPKRFVSNGTDGAALVLYNFAWASYEQIITEQAAASRAGFSNFKPALNTPLAFSQLAVHLNPDLDGAHYLVGAVYGTYELPDEAIAAYGKVDFTNPFYEYAKMDMADAWIAQEENDKAIKLLQTFIAEDGLTPDAGLKLADLLSRQGDYDEADRVLTDTIGLADRLMGESSKQANLWRFYFARGAMRLEADRWEDAEADLQKAVSLSPDQPYVLNFLGYSWAERGINLDEAFEMIEKALTLLPSSGAITDSLGWAHYQLGNYGQAVENLERAVELEPADPVITDHLGDAYWQTGRKIEARYEWRRALTFEPDDKLRGEIELKLAGGVVKPGASAGAGGAQ